MSWSDGNLYTADDILYWWNHEVKDDGVAEGVPPIMTLDGKSGTITKIDEYTIKIGFHRPYPLFLDRAATSKGIPLPGSPAHYLKQYHPRLGSKKKIEEMMAVTKSASASSLYSLLKSWDNPDHPRLWAWVVMQDQNKPPLSFVRNPYYFAVDSGGNQLPYVDRVLQDERIKSMHSVAASTGQPTFMLEIEFSDYPLLMSQRENYNYEVYHWYPGNASLFLIFPNLNRRVDPDDPRSKWVRRYNNKKEFRQALSLAINREFIINTEFANMSEPAQLAPIGGLPYEYPKLKNAYVEYDPERARALLDSIGLDEKNDDGMRLFPDGTPALFYIDHNPEISPGVAEIVTRYWRDVGLRFVPRMRSPQIFFTERDAAMQDFIITRMNGKINPLIEPKNYVATRDSDWARRYGRWYSQGGLRGDPEATSNGAEVPPSGSALMESMKLADKALRAPDKEERVRLFRQVLEIASEQIWIINIGTHPPSATIVKDGLRNVPRTAFKNWDFMTPANAGLELYFWESNTDSPQTQQSIRDQVSGYLQDRALLQAQNGDSNQSKAVSILLRIVIWGAVIVLVALVVARHKFVFRRILIAVPSLAVISIIVFSIIELPPGDYISSMIIQLESQGEEADLQRIKELKQIFLLDESPVTRYASWLGLKWFFTFDSADMGLLQGHLGRSMESLKSVNEIVGDRILLTFAISMGSILFTWVLAVPIGIFSAVKKYSFSDYCVTLLGFIGMSVPNFLLALILMYFGASFLNLQVSGLFSPEYMTQVEWTWGKFIDLLQHIWIPIIVVGTAGTAGMIRVMRGNLLDELKKPYVVTARAKGVRPIKLIFKYPVRLALNPFISGIGGIFPALVSGGAIVALVLSLPTVGPLLLNALMIEDVYMAASMLMVLSLLSVFGVLVSDLLLMILDPRIRIEGEIQK